MGERAPPRARRARRGLLCARRRFDSALPDHRSRQSERTPGRCKANSQAPHDRGTSAVTSTRVRRCRLPSFRRCRDSRPAGRPRLPGDETGLREATLEQRSNDTHGVRTERSASQFRLLAITKALLVRGTDRARQPCTQRCGSLALGRRRFSCRTSPRHGSSSSRATKPSELSSKARTATQDKSLSPAVSLTHTDRRSHHSSREGRLRRSGADLDNRGAQAVRSQPRAALPGHARARARTRRLPPIHRPPHRGRRLVIGVLAREMGAFCAALQTGRSATLSPLEATYADYRRMGAKLARRQSSSARGERATSRAPPARLPAPRTVRPTSRGRLFRRATARSLRDCSTASYGCPDRTRPRWTIARFS